MFRRLARREREPERRPFVPTADGLASALTRYLDECDHREAALVAGGGDPAFYADASAQRSAVRTMLDEYRAGVCPVCRKPSCDGRPGHTIGASCSRGLLGARLMTTCAPEPTSERVEPLDAPVATSGSKYRHQGLEVHVFTYAEYEPLHIVLTNCGLATHKWKRCTERRQPCRRCYAK